MFIIKYVNNEIMLKMKKDIDIISDMWYIMKVNKS